MQTYTPPKPAPLPHDFDEFWAERTEEEKELHHMAVEMLGSSYFVQWAHMYVRWSKAKAEKQKKAQTIMQ